MSLALKAVLKAEEQLPKVIPPAAHGLIDYCQAAFFLGMALACRRRNRRAAWAALLTGSFLLVESLWTDYPMGVFKAIPFPLHGRLDRSLAGASMAIPRAFGFEHSAPAAIFRGHSALAGAVAGMTDWEGKRKPDRAA